MERASGDHLEDDQARRRRVGRDAERLQRIGSAQDAYLTLRMIENPAGDAQGILAAAEQLAFGRQTTPVDGRRHDLIPFSSRIDAHANSVLWILVTGTTTQTRVMRRLIRSTQPFPGTRRPPPRTPAPRPAGT